VLFKAAGVDLQSTPAAYGSVIRILHKQYSIKITTKAPKILKQNCHFAGSFGYEKDYKSLAKKC
jgi:hypothetical protein